MSSCLIKYIFFPSGQLLFDLADKVRQDLLKTTFSKCATLSSQDTASPHKMFGGAFLTLTDYACGAGPYGARAEGVSKV
jgi:hypothetical protein